LGGQIRHTEVNADATPIQGVGIEAHD
jgi:hypothetical protein